MIITAPGRHVALAMPVVGGASRAFQKNLSGLANKTKGSDNERGGGGGKNGSGGVAHPEKMRRKAAVELDQAKLDKPSARVPSTTASCDIPSHAIAIPLGGFPGLDADTKLSGNLACGQVQIKAGLWIGG